MDEAIVDANPAPELRLGRVMLRPHRWSDLDDIVASCRDPEIQRWTLMPDPYRPEDARDYLGRSLGSSVDGEYRWAVCTVDDDRLHGNIGLIPDGPGGAEVGYYLSSWARGRRLASAALWLACEWGFRGCDLQVITWGAIVGNERSRRMAERVGFRIHADVRRLAIVQRGVRRDSWTGEILPGELVAGESLL